MAALSVWNVARLISLLSRSIMLIGMEPHIVSACSATAVQGEGPSMSGLESFTIPKSLGCASFAYHVISASGAFPNNKKAPLPRL